MGRVETTQSAPCPASPAAGVSAAQADDQAWTCVQGSPMRLLSLERKPDVLCCNAYVLDSPSFLLVVDPGADDDQTARLGHILADQVRRAPRPILALLTHAHRDHALALTALSEAAGAPITLMAHTVGADALEAGDAHFTHSDLTGKTFPRIPVTFRLFADGPALAAGPLPGSTSELSWSGGSSPLLRQRLRLGPDEVLDIYHTPGHSPDSTSLHVGDQIFVGDVLSAAAPGVAGKVG